MKNVAFGLTIVAGLVVGLVCSDGTGGLAWAQRSPLERAAAGELLAFMSDLDEHRQQLTVLDPRLRVVSVYHLDRGTGEIGLRSVRNLNWDLQMMEYNNAKPRPTEIQRLVEQR